MLEEVKGTRTRLRQAMNVGVPAFHPSCSRHDMGTALT